MRVIAHRGASVTHQENTIDAFSEALHQGAVGVELDVRLSADEVLVVHHDATLADGSVIRQTASSDLPDWIPTLGEALDTCAGYWVNVEIKNVAGEPDYDSEHRISEAVASLLAAYMESIPDSGESSTGSYREKLRNNVLVSSFNVDAMIRIGELDGDIPLGMLVFGQADPASLVARAVGHGFEAIHPHDVLVDRAFVKRSHDAGLAVNVWTVDDPARIVELAEMGADSVITNDPAAACVALG